MSWQEDLAELDRTLAEGRISADEYRRRRDELLASATSSGAVGSPGTPPAPQQAPSGPFAPPVRWDAVPPRPQTPNPEATQVVNNQANQQAGADKTQVVSGQQRGQDADRTQYVAPITPPPGMPQQQPQQQGWQSGPPVGTPPWGDSFSPGDQNPSWIAQGPEVFDESGGGGKGKVVGIVVAVVLLAGIAFGAYWLWGRDSGSDQAGGGTSTSSTPTTTSSTPPPDPLPVGEIPGKVSTNKAVTDFSAVPNLKYLLDSEAALYTAAGATKTKLAQFTLDDGSLGVVLIVQATDATAASAAAEELFNTQINNGMAQHDGGPAGVSTGEIDAANGQNARVRGHYSSKDLIVRVDVAAPTLAAAQKGYEEALDAQLEVLPTDG
ncbi:hypothetical protein [Saccharothrix yanglingensis]|uniref:SHOCT domain-containing protein n=1 Tax=Saccharothrix yanglingensis TaxID=659496 RepID=A0ABU0WTF4_9PSEU|nr:hypothetical protein [Saccharothrix yanglingensis]MDQ2583125.1 hypothetical protein [Saccharothrix yanglingensis]